MVKKKRKMYDKDGFPIKRKTNELAIASLIASLAGVFIPYASIVAIVLGFISLSQIKKDPQRYEGRGMAKAGIIIGIIMISLKVLLILIYIILAVVLISLPFFLID